MIGVYIQGGSMTEEQYHAVDDRVRAAVAGVPEGMKLHTCFREGEGLAIFDVWESEEAFQAFGAKLMPIVHELGVDLPAPHFVEMVTYDVV